MSLILISIQRVNHIFRCNRDAIGLKGICMEDEGMKLPKASTCEKAIEKAKEDAEDFDYTKGTLIMIKIDFIAYRRRMG